MFSVLYKENLYNIILHKKVLSFYKYKGNKALHLIYFQNFILSYAG